MNLKKLERYLQVNLLGPGPRLIKQEFTGPWSHKGWETLHYINWSLFVVEMDFIVGDVATNWLFIIKLIMAIECLKGLVAGLSSHRPEFEPRLVHVGFVVDEFQLRLFSSGYFGFLF